MPDTCITCLSKDGELLKITEDHFALVKKLVNDFNVSVIPMDKWYHCSDCIMKLQMIANFQNLALKSLHTMCSAWEITIPEVPDVQCQGNMSPERHFILESNILDSNAEREINVEKFTSGNKSPKTERDGSDNDDVTPNKKAKKEGIVAEIIEDKSNALLTESNKKTIIILKKITTSDVKKVTLKRAESTKKGQSPTIIAKEKKGKKAKKKALYACGECGTTFPNTVLLNRHTAYHCREYICKRCGHRTNTERWARQHKCRIVEEPSEPSSPKPEEPKEYKCEYCEAVFKTRNTKYFHVVSKHKNPPTVQCELCGATLKNKFQLYTHMQYRHDNTLDGAGDFRCHDCSLAFKTDDSYRHHLQYSVRHAPPDRHICEYCGKNFYLAKRLQDHIELRHLKQHQFPCNQCEKSYASQHNLQRHLATAHATPSRPVETYMCEVCGRDCESIAALNKHSLRHTSEPSQPTASIPNIPNIPNNLQCSICQATFLYSGALKTHNRLAHGIGELTELV